MKLSWFIIATMFFLFSCRQKKIDEKCFGTDAEIIKSEKDSFVCRFVVTNGLSHEVKIHCAGHNVRLICFPRVRLDNGEVLHEYAKEIPLTLSIDAKSSITFECDLKLSEDEQRLFKQRKMRFEYPVVSYSIAGQRYDVNDIGVDDAMWLMFELRTQPKQNLRNQPNIVD